MLETAPQIQEKKSSNPLKKFAKIIFWLVFVFIFFMISSVVLVFIYENEVKETIIKELNKNLKSEVRIDPKNIDLTFIQSFPKCALEFKKVLILEATEKKDKDTLIFADKISLLFSLKDIWNKNYTINKIQISKASCYLSIDKKGNPNYIFWKTSKKKADDNVKFNLDKISLNEINLRYKNHKSKIKFEAYFSNSQFLGNFSENSFALETKGSAELYNLVLNKNTLLSDKKIKYDLNFEIVNSLYKISKANLALNEMNFSIDGDFYYKDSLEKADLSFIGRNLDIGAVLSLLPEKYSERIKDYESDGEFYSKGTVNYKAGITSDIKAEFGINNATVTYKPNNTQLRNLSLIGKIHSNDVESALNIQNISGEMGKNNFSGFCIITNFSDPYVNASASINTNLEELNAFWPIDTVEYVSGQISLNASLKGNVNDIRKSVFSPNVIAKGNASINNIKTKIRGKAEELNITSGELEIANRSVLVRNFKLLVGKSDVELNGELPGFINYLLDDKSPLMINASLKSINLKLEDILYAGQETGEKKRIHISDNLNFKLAVNIENLTFSKFEAQNISGDVIINNQKLIINDLFLSAMEGKAHISAIADASGDAIEIKLGGDLNKINISKLFYQFNNFGQNTLNEKHLNGYATSDVMFSGIWSKELVPDLSSIVAEGKLLIEEGRLVDFKPLLSLSKYVEVNELKDIKFQTLQSNFEIKNQIISIPKTSIKNSALNIEFWGKHTFKNEIDYHIQLLMSELLANKKRSNKQLDDEMTIVENDPENRRSVFVLMTGTVENPIIKYDRKGLKQKIGEDIKEEKHNLKQLLKEEFGLFKKDTTLNKAQDTKAEQKFQIEFGEKKEKKQNALQPKKKEEDDEDF